MALADRIFPIQEEAHEGQVHLDQVRMIDWEGEGLHGKLHQGLYK